MNGKSLIPGGLFPYAGKKIALRGLVFLALFLVLAFARGGELTPAQAAPADQAKIVTYRYVADAVANPGPFCVNVDEPIGVGVFQQVETISGRAISSKRSGLPHIYVESQVADESIGSMILPTVTLTKGLHEDFTFGHALFMFHPKKAGKTQITFRALIPSARTGSQDKWISPKPLPIEVVNCAYSVYTTVVWNVSGPDISFSGIGVTDEIGLKRKEGTQDFEGDGSFKYFGGAGHVGECSGQAELKSGPIHITGQLVDKKLALTLNYSPGTMTYHVRCPGGDSIDPSVPWVYEQPVEEFSESGETKTFETLMGLGPAKGTITVVPKKK